MGEIEGAATTAVPTVEQPGHDMQRLSAPAAAGDYPILVGRHLLEETAAAFAARPGPRLLVSDAHVARAQPAWLDALQERVEHRRFAIKAGEDAKNSATLLELLHELRLTGLERGSPLLAFGGGVVGDSAGLAASLWLRGVPWIQAPTSLLAMLDSSVGGKTAVNFGGLKNAVGAFHAPVAVFADLELLRTLPDAQWTCGFGELLKAAWLSDGAWAEALEAEPEAVLDADAPGLEDAVARAVAVKISFVAGDEFEAGRRRLLNLGHSFAHALESESEMEIGHGQAVLLGLLAALVAARETGRWSPAAAEARLGRLAALLERLGVARPADCEDVDALLDWMRRDKKVEGGALRLVLPLERGGAELATVDESVVRLAWRELSERTPCASR